MAGPVFISYKRGPDEGFTKNLAAELDSHNIEVWLDQWSIQKGADWNRAIDQALEACGAFLIVLSPESVESDEVRGELLAALGNQKKVVPVLYRECRLPRQLLNIQYVDFVSRAPNDAETLSELVGVLRAAGARPSRQQSQTKPRGSRSSDEDLIGFVSRYYPAHGAAGVELQSSIRQGEWVRIAGDRTNFTQRVRSIEIDRRRVKSANAGVDVGLKVDEPVYPGDAIFRDVDGRTDTHSGESNASSDGSFTLKATGLGRVTAYPIGRVKHYYDRIGVASVDLDEELGCGENVLFQGENSNYWQTVTSIQKDREPVQWVNNGREIGLKVDDPVEIGDIVYRLV